RPAGRPPQGRARRSRRARRRGGRGAPRGGRGGGRSVRRRLRTPMRLVLVALLAAAVSGCQVMQRISESSYRKAVANGAAEELEARGVELREAPACTPPERRPGPGSVVRGTCRARAPGGEAVTAGGLGRRAAPR